MPLLGDTSSSRHHASTSAPPSHQNTLLRVHPPPDNLYPTKVPPQDNQSRSSSAVLDRNRDRNLSNAVVAAAALLGVGKGTPSGTRSGDPITENTSEFGRTAAALSRISISAPTSASPVLLLIAPTSASSALVFAAPILASSTMPRVRCRSARPSLRANAAFNRSRFSRTGRLTALSPSNSLSTFLFLSTTLSIRADQLDRCSRCLSLSLSRSNSRSRSTRSMLRFSLSLSLSLSLSILSNGHYATFPTACARSP
eukprot:COSAG02_NODE_2662_length_8303_cov_7.299976_9_plen_255_part_00